MGCSSNNHKVEFRNSDLKIFLPSNLRGRVIRWNYLGAINY